MKSAGNYVTKPADPSARAAVATITKDIIRRWSELGGVHLQIGKKYPYSKTREPATRMLVEQFKQLVDPRGIFNPGNLLPQAADAGGATVRAGTLP
jgi:FAD/FMN-containing dehydrogenase